MTDILDVIDETLNSLDLCACGCGQTLTEGSSSPWYAGEACQMRWMERGKGTYSRQVRATVTITMNNPTPELDPITETLRTTRYLRADELPPRAFEPHVGVCLLCSWRMTGEAERVMQAMREHVDQAHPEPNDAVVRPAALVDAALHHVDTQGAGSFHVIGRGDDAREVPCDCDSPAHPDDTEGPAMPADQQEVEAFAKERFELTPFKTYRPGEETWETLSEESREAWRHAAAQILAHRASQRAGRKPWWRRIFKIGGEVRDVS